MILNILSMLYSRGFIKMRVMLEKNVLQLENIPDSHTSDFGYCHLYLVRFLFFFHLWERGKCYLLWTCHTEMKGKNTRNFMSIVETNGKLGGSEIPDVEYLFAMFFW